MRYTHYCSMIAASQLYHTAETNENRSRALRMEIGKLQTSKQYELSISKRFNKNYENKKTPPHEYKCNVRMRYIYNRYVIKSYIL